MQPKEALLRNIVTQRGLRYVPARGNFASGVVFVGEAPGVDEEINGLPFIGKAGQELDRMARDAGFSANDYWLTNPIKVRPPSNDLERLHEYGIDQQLFIDQFIEELSEHKPTIIVACGATSLGILCPGTLSRRDGDVKITQWRGSLLHSPLLGWDHYVIPMLHPAFVLREWAERQTAVFCLARAQEEMAYYRKNGKLQPLPERELIVEPAYAVAVEYLRSALAQPEPVSNDIEMLGVRRGDKTIYIMPDMIAIARNPRLAMSMSLWDYPVDQLVVLWRLVDEILRKKRQIGQNYIGFDCIWLEYLGFSPNVQLVSDTLVRHHVLYPEFEHKLQFQAFQFTREPYWKDEGRLWKPSDGKAAKMRYNAKDAAVTYEIHDVQEGEFDERPSLRAFYEQYEMRLAQAFHSIQKRGLLTDPSRLDAVRRYLEAELATSCGAISRIVGRPSASDKASATVVAKSLGIKLSEVFNLGSVKQVSEILTKTLKLPLRRKHGSLTGYITDEKAIQALYAKTGHKVCKELLRVRELVKMRGTYVDAKTANNVLYTSIVTTATVTGRRGSRTNVFGLGTNLQNLPKHSDLAKKFRECVVARPGKVFVQADQKGAEDWIVQGIISDVQGFHSPGLIELIQGINRHRKRAAFLFSKPEAECGRDTTYYFMGKKVGHAGNYDMKAHRMSEEFTKEGFHVPENYCEWLLGKFHEYEPGIKGVFHDYIQRQLKDNRFLKTPLGRERFFFALRPFSDNSDIYRDGYAYIPQSTVGDNTGLAVVFCEDRSTAECQVLLDVHDSILLEVDDRDEAIISAVKLLTDSFDRIIRFPVSGLELKIPVEFEVGYDMAHMATCLDTSNIGLRSTLATLRTTRSHQLNITTGQPLQPLQQL